MTEGLLEKAVLGGGCFWCLEAIYQRQDGVLRVISGYAGGTLPNPTYEQVCAKDTGHVEVVEVTYDTSVVSFAELLDLFWQAHDPTTKDRQGNDVGHQYRSVIMTIDAAQEEVARASCQVAQAIFPAPIVTEISRLDQFWPAEVTHQDYYNRNKMAPYCMFVIAPKLSKMGK